MSWREGRDGEIPHRIANPAHTNHGVISLFLCECVANLSSSDPDRVADAAHIAGGVFCSLPINVQCAANFPSGSYGIAGTAHIAIVH